MVYLPNKYTRWYYNIVNTAKTRVLSAEVYTEQHHIIPKSLGGIETVFLTAKEHFLCHLLLCKMLEGTNKHKMINALIKMTFSKSKGQKRYTSKSFSLVKKLIAEKNSEMFKGRIFSESTIEKMKQNNGRYIRTDIHRENISNIQKKRFEKEKGTFTGRNHSEETKILFKKQRKGKTKGKRFYTNGTIDKLCYPGQQPQDFWLGLTNTKWRKQNACS